VKAVLLTAPFTVNIRETDKPEAGLNEVLIKVKATSICGSDLHAYRGTHPFRNPPVILGHELAGEVEQVGTGVKMIRVGEAVTVEPWKHCGRCPYCLEGKYNLCTGKQAMGTTAWQGSFAEYVVAPEGVVHKLPQGVSYEEGALVEPLAVGVHTVGEARVRLGESVVVLGAGSIGLMILTCLRVAGATKLIITDIENFNLKLAAQFGATETVNVKEKSVQEVVDKVTGGEGVDIAVIAAGEKSLVNEASKIAKKSGRIVVPAIFEQSPEVDMFKIVYGEQNIQGSWAYIGKDFNVAIDLLALGKIDLKPLISHHFPLDDAEKAFDILDKRSKKVVKILFTF
jgi:L-iditol 2-dehydrogenase